VRFSSIHNTYLDDGNIAGDVPLCVEKTVREDRRKEVKEVKDAKEKRGDSVRLPLRGLRLARVDVDF
jgi:hypothetical protein